MPAYHEVSRDARFVCWIDACFGRCAGLGGQSRGKRLIFYIFFEKVLENKIFALSLHPQSVSNVGCKVQDNAEIAQLVEHNLAKVGVASSSLVFRSENEEDS